MIWYDDIDVKFQIYVRPSYLDYFEGIIRHLSSCGQKVARTRFLNNAMVERSYCTPHVFLENSYHDLEK